jgi:uncharacterized protein YbjT (DUF2867 family)
MRLFKKQDAPGKSVHAVTGAFGYTGKYIAERLLDAGKSVITLTGHPERANPFGDAVRAVPFNFDRPEALKESLEDVDVVYNTYWVRFAHGDTTFEGAVANTKTLINAAKAAGVRRFVHISITNPSLDSPLPYFRGKAQLEAYLQGAGLSYAVLRPTVVFGPEDILLNNIAYILRRFPVFVMPGKGDYRLQPVYVDDLAALAVEEGASAEDRIIDAVGPETLTFAELLETVKERVGSKARIVSMPPDVALLLSKAVGLLVRDVVLTRDELEGLTRNLLVSDSPPTGTVRFSDWARETAHLLGTSYASELARHYRPAASSRT